VYLGIGDRYHNHGLNRGIQVRYCTTPWGYKTPVESRYTGDFVLGIVIYI